MDFKKRKKSFDPVFYYLKLQNCSMEELLGLKANVQALDVAIDRALKRVHKLRSGLKVKIEDDTEWLD